MIRIHEKLSSNHRLLGASGGFDARDRNVRRMVEVPGGVIAVIQHALI